MSIEIEAYAKPKALFDDRKTAMTALPAYLEIVEFIASGTTPRSVADFTPSLAMQERAVTLLVAAKAGQLTPEQESELDSLTELEHILRMAKARARQILEAA